MGHILENLGYQNILYIGEGLNSWVYKGNLGTSSIDSGITHVLKVSKQEADFQELEYVIEKALKVRSKYCPAIFGWHRLEGRSILVMDYVQGVSLSSLAGSGCLDLAMISEIVAQIQEALVDLHEQGVVHGDLHTNNVLVDRAGRIQLIDFGQIFSKDFEGSPAYMAPELWAGSKVSVGSDYFALALVEEDLLRWNHLGVRNLLNLKKRAYDSVNENDPWLKRNPNERSPKSLSASSAVTREKLSQCVRLLSHESAKTRDSLNTQVLQDSFSQKILMFKNGLGLLAMILFLACVPVEKTVKHELKNSFLSELRIQTSKWVQVSLQDRKFEYSPVVFTGLSPGVVKIRWRALGSQGFFYLTLKPGESAFLSDRDFKSFK